MFKKYLYILILTYLITSCGAGDSIKRGISGDKKKSTDEFLVQKKDPLILPPDFNDLPIPNERAINMAENPVFEKTLETSSEAESSSASSIEQSIVNKIKNK
jgi:hypothetical protein